MSSNKYISIKGARQHNLKNISLELPKDSIIVITGVSGSGKSSLAFETIYAEGQRRYVESLSAYARQFLDSFTKPDVDSIEGLSPAISIEQKTTSKNPRSTVGTITEIYDYLRLLYARVGIAYSPATGLPIEKQTVSQMVDKVLETLDGKRIYIESPVVRARKGEYKKDILSYKKQGFERVKIDGLVYEIDDAPNLDKNIKHDISIVVDRLKVSLDSKTRLADSFETALKLSSGLAIVEDAETSTTITFSEKFACPVSGFTIEEIEPRLFSFNNPVGSCSVCHGLGSESYFSEELIIPNKNLALVDAINLWHSDYYSAMLIAVAKQYKIDPRTPYKNLTQEFKKVILNGSGKINIHFKFEMTDISVDRKKPFEGIIPNLERRYKETNSESVRQELEKYQTVKECEACGGKRLNEKALAVKIDKKSISDITEFSIISALNWIETLDKIWTKKEKTISERIVKEIRERLTFLKNVGIGYLSLNRMAGTLSGGEAQRIRLASQIGSGLTGVLYVLDEPSIGLHQKDNDKLIETLKHLRDLGNTVIVVEHDEDAIKTADYIVDMGPYAGRLGGEVVASGTIDDILKNKNSLTGQYLSGAKKIEVPKKRRAGNKKFIKITGASGNNLQNVSCSIPLGTLTCVTGVSGSGKSTLINDTLYKGVAKHLNREVTESSLYKKIEGLDAIDSIIEIDQSPIGRTPRSNPATYTKVFDYIREFYAELEESKMRGYTTGRFSFNVKGGRCEACSGDGLIKIEMHFLPDVFVTCDECQGKRYNRETLEIKLKDKSIADVLDMTVDEACDFFVGIKRIHEKLKTLQEVGLGYMHVGQQATTLSGGEAQRIKLAKELSKRSTGKTLYILDEPTTGLHFADIDKLMEVLNRIVNAGNTIVVIEHNMDVIKTADYIIDLGPEGGTGGGKIIATGTPEEIAKNKNSYTGEYLKRYLK